MSQTKNTMPALIAYTVRDGKDANYWTRIGAAWLHENGDGFTIRLDALPLNGEIVLRAPKAEDAAQEGGPR